MKKRIIVLIVIITIIAFASGGVVALTLYADDIIYNPSNSEFKVDNAQSALDELYNMIDSFGKNDSLGQTVVTHFGGKEILANEKTFGGTGCGSNSSASYTAKGLVVENIDPRIFSEIRYQSQYAAGACYGTYAPSYSGYFKVNFVDKVTGEIVKTTGAGNITVDLSEFENPVDMYVDAYIATEVCNAPWASCYLSTTYLKVKENYEG